MSINDPHGQPYNLSFNARNRTERDLAEMLGLAKGMLADGTINAEEARYLHDWGANHPDALMQWPLSLIFSRLRQFFADGRIDEDERLELQEILASLVGGTASLMLGYEAGTTLPLDNPPPRIYWDQEVFVFTGRFAYGPRRICEMEAITRGAAVADDVTPSTTFLVIGSFGSRDWAQSNYGRKIQRAVKLRDEGFPLRIVGEDHWATAVSSAVPF
jgi:hypothetical protein